VRALDSAVVQNTAYFSERLSPLYQPFTALRYHRVQCPVGIFTRFIFYNIKLRG